MLFNQRFAVSPAFFVAGWVHFGPRTRIKIVATDHNSAKLASIFKAAVDWTQEAEARRPTKRFGFSLDGTGESVKAKHEISRTN